MINPQLLIRYIHYKLLIEEFLISSLVAILSIRFFLKISNYPQLGGDILHISHMLWGGLLMFIAIILLLTLMNNEVKRVAAIIGGLGFGTFIDELGKFITSDNNYFYQPTFALIYIFFVLIYLLLQFVQNRHEFTEKEYLANSIELMKDAVVHDLDSNEKTQAMHYLSKSHTDNTIARTLKNLYTEIEATKPRKPHVFTRIKKFLQLNYFYFISQSWFKHVVVSFFLIQGLLSLIITILLIIERNVSILPAFLLPHSFTTKSYNLIHLYSTLIAVFFIFIGISRIYVSRMSAYIMFKRSILISILLTQVFVFYYSPIRAFTTLIFNIVILITLNYLIQTEAEMQVRKKS